MACETEGVCEELKAAALRAFEPMVLHFSSTTPHNVSMDTVVETFTRDHTLRGRFHVVDTRSLQAAANGATAAVPSRPHKAGGREKGQNAGGGANGSGPMAADTAEARMAELIRAEYERIAIAREAARREAVAAQARRLAEVMAQYMEDGLTEEEARQAAEEDLREEDGVGEDDDNSEADSDTAAEGSTTRDGGSRVAAGQERGSGDGQPHAVRPPIPSFPGSAAVAGQRRREPLFLCVSGGFPNALDDVRELFSNQVPLHAIFNIVSKVPLTGSSERARLESGEKARGRPDPRAPSASGSAQGKRGNRGGSVAANNGKPHREEEAPAPLPDMILRHQQQDRCGGCARCCAVGEVLVHTVEFPSQPAGGASGAAEEFRLVSPEKVVLQSIKDTVISVEKQLQLYRVLVSRRRHVVTVPAYSPLPEPRVVSKAAPRASANEEKGGESRPTSRMNSLQRRSTTPPRKVSPGPPSSLTSSAPPTGADGDTAGRSGADGAALASMTAAVPRAMNEVAARTVEYDGVNRNPSLPGKWPPQIVASFVAACIRQTQASVDILSSSSSAPPPTAEATLPGEEEGSMAAPAADSALSRDPGAARPELLLSEEAASELAMSRDRAAVLRYASQVFASAFGCEGRGSDAVVSHAPRGDAAHVDAVGSPEHVPPLSGPAADAATLRSEMERLLSTTFPHLPRATVAEQVGEAMRWAVASSGAASLATEVLQGMCAAKHMLGWRTALTGTHTPAGELAVLSRGDGSPRCAELVYAFDSATTFPAFLRYLRFCAAEHDYFYPSPPSSDADEEADSVASIEESADEADESSSSSSSGSDNRSGGDGDASSGHSPGQEALRDLSGKKKKSRGGQRVAPPSPPPPLVDHFRILQRLLHRRRVFEEVKSRFACRSEYMNELVTKGPAAHGAGERVEWVFPADGCTLEVALTSANTRQLSCTVTTPACPPAECCEMGFLLHDESTDTRPRTTPPGCVEPQTSATVRAFLRFGNAVQLMTEVIADNSLAADRQVYERAVAEARASAKAQFEVLQGGPKGKGGKGGGGRDKTNPAAQPTLAELEEAAVAAVPVPVERPKTAPQVRLAMTLHPCSGPRGPSHGQLRQSDGALDLRFDSTAPCYVDVRVAVWRAPVGAADAVAAGHEEVRHVSSIAGARYLVDGSVEVSPLPLAEWKDYCVLLGPRGSLVVAHTPSSTLLVTAANGERRLYARAAAAAEGTSESSSSSGEAPVRLARRLAPVTSAMKRRAASAVFTMHRADGVALEYECRPDGAGVAGGEDSLMRVRFGSGVAVWWKADDGAPASRSCVWEVGSSPPTHVECCPSRQQWTLFAPATVGSCAAVTYDHVEQTVMMRDCLATPTGEGRVAPALEGSGAFHVAAALHLRQYRLEWETFCAAPTPVRSRYAVDCAFGGLYAEVVEGTSGAPLTPLLEAAARRSSATSILRVSPCGRVSLERGGEPTPQQELPQGYTAGGDAALLSQPLLLAPEVLSPGFVSVLDGTGVALDAAHALHLCAQPKTAVRDLLFTQEGGVVSWVPTPTPHTAAMNAAVGHELSKATRAFRGLVMAARGSTDGEVRRQTGRRALLACRWTPTTPHPCVTFLGPRMASCLVDKWCRAAAARATGAGPDGDSPSPSDALHALRPRLIGHHGGVVDEYAVSSHHRVFTAVDEADAACVDQWWRSHASSLEKEPVAPVNDEPRPVEASDVTEAPSHNKPTPTSAFESARAESDVHLEDAVSRGDTTGHKQRECGRLNYWASISAPSRGSFLKNHMTRSSVHSSSSAQRSSCRAANTPDTEVAADTVAQAAATATADQSVERVAAAVPRRGPPIMYTKLSTLPAASVAAAGAASTMSTVGRPEQRSHAGTLLHTPSLVLTASGPRKTKGASAETAAPSSSFAVDFGDVAPGRRYACAFAVTNTSTVPCRYRISVPNALKDRVSVSYPHRFLAAGMTDTVTITLSTPPSAGDGPHVETLCLTYEGAAREVRLSWSTGEAALSFAASGYARGKAAAAPLAAGVVCLGSSLPAFQPGTTRRVRRGSEDDEDSAEALRAPRSQQERQSADSTSTESESGESVEQDVQPRGGGDSGKQELIA